MEKLIGNENGYNIYVGIANPSCYPCCWEGSVYPCPRDICKRWTEEYLKNNKLDKGERIYLKRDYK